MLPLIIGISTGLISIVLINILSKSKKQILYGLVLSGIGFLYVGYTWSSLSQLSMNIVQAFIFVLFAYYGITRSIYILALGYFLHGLWDLMYSYLTTVNLIPPHYDIFCLAVDFVMGAYILISAKRLAPTV